MNIDFVKVTAPGQTELIAEIAEPIWHETYEPIIGNDAVCYMVEKFQSVSAINRQLAEEGYEYYLMYSGDSAVGFIGAVPNMNGKLFLSKLYVSRDYRGMGVPRAAFEFLAQLGRGYGLDKIYLTVNKKNAHAIEVYEHFGFYRIDSVVTDIGCGYVMDDYILQKDI